MGNIFYAAGASYQRTRRTVTVDEQQESTLERYEQRVEPYLSAGIVYPYRRLSFFATLEYEGQLTAGVGVRLGLFDSPYAR